MDNLRPESEKDVESLVAIGRSVRFLIHEIKNPLTAISFRCEMLRDEAARLAEGEPGHGKNSSGGSDGDAFSEINTLIESIEEDVERINGLCGHVGSFFSDPVGSSDVLDLVSFLTSVAASFGNNVSVEINVRRARVVFDREKLRSVLENLIKNALESAEAAGRDKKEKAEVCLSERDGFYVIDIRDRGAGVSPDVRERMFEPFYTTKTQGSGIGLFLSKRFLEARGGRISIENRPGGGAVCTVVLCKA